MKNGWQVNNRRELKILSMDGYLQNTLHGILNCECKGNCILKSLHIDEIYNDSAFITVEPFDDAFNQNQVEETIDKIKRVVWRRREQIWAMLDVESVSVTVYDEWTMKDAFVLSLKSNSITSSVS